MHDHKVGAREEWLAAREKHSLGLGWGPRLQLRLRLLVDRGADARPRREAVTAMHSAVSGSPPAASCTPTATACLARTPTRRTHCRRRCFAPGAGCHCSKGEARFAPGCTGSRPTRACARSSAGPRGSSRSTTPPRPHSAGTPDPRDHGVRHPGDIPALRSGRVNRALRESPTASLAWDERSSGQVPTRRAIPLRV
jgi:hypothetical protein